MNRRSMMVAMLAAASASALTPFGARADDWRTAYPEIRFAVRPNENAAGMSRWEGLAKYLEGALRVKVSFRQATDYAGLVEALKSKRLELAMLGGSGYAQAFLVTDGNIEPVATILGQDHDSGYYSMIVVKADGPYHSIDDLKGKKLVFADPNSTSGYQVPSFFLRQQGHDPKTFFSQTGFAGNHEGAVMAVVNGTYDAAATWYTTEERTNVTRMVAKGMIPKDAVRMVWRSPEIQGDAFVVRKDLPAPMREAIRTALLDLGRTDSGLLKELGDGTFTGTAPIDQAAFEPLIQMVRDNLAQRRQ